MNPQKTLTVRLNKAFVGYLEQNSQGGFRFTYDENNKMPLSLSLPLRTEPFDGRECRGFFEGLLPEGESVRLYIGKKYGINPKNEFSLLKAIGYDCAGAVSFSDYEANPKNYEDDFVEIRGTKFDDKSLEEFINELPKKPLLTNSDGLRLSLAGAQDKMAVVLLDNVVGLPQQEVPTTHILKPAIKDFDGSIENEYICLKTAKKMGLDVCDCEIRSTQNIKYLLVERYDRKIKDGKISRVHQEDFCQAKNIISTFKYEREGGIRIKDCFEIVEKTHKSAFNIVELMNRIIFNYLIGNADAHGKNFSLLYTDEGILLAPAYDILCTAVYPELAKQMAMKIGGYYDADRIYPRHWKRMAEDVGFNYTYLRKMILKQAQELPKELAEVIADVSEPIGEKILEIVKTNCEKTLARFETENN